MLKDFLLACLCCLIMVSAKAHAVPVTVDFVNPAGYVDGFPLASDDITEYKYILYSSTQGEIENVTFPNTGVTSFNLDLPLDIYVVCVFVKVIAWSEANCKIFNTNDPQQVKMCD